MVEKIYFCDVNPIPFPLPSPYHTFLGRFGASSSPPIAFLFNLGIVPLPCHKNALKRKYKQEGGGSGILPSVLTRFKKYCSNIICF